jgi:glycosyltransferase involved in cell wall biosynthesis
LATALSNLSGCRPQEEFVFIVLESAGNWLDQHIGGPCRLHKIPLTWKNKLSHTPLGPAARLLNAGLRRLRPPPAPGLIESDGTAERLGATLVHFPTQEGYLTNIPTIYQPHDLQHLHLPQYFPAAELAWRNLAYPVYCDRAGIVLVESSWTKDDVARQYGIAESKIAVCPFPPATTAYREMTPGETTRFEEKLLHRQFILYPANTWPHKNHLALLEALASLKRTGLQVPLVCTGRATPFFSEIEAAVRRLDLSGQVQFPGYLSESEIKALYHLCSAVVVPTKFESVSFPVWEAFEAGKPVACSAVTSLPMQVGQAGLLFDPDDPAAIANAIQSLWNDADLRNRLGRLGTERLRQFSLDGMARHMRALYRRLGGTLDGEDQMILDAPPLI